ncbi:MAG TPA: DUF445 family protein [Acetivibrio clariflavus]|nr:DUF445 family protein [Acetivibrio clariflavus]
MQIIEILSGPIIGAVIGYFTNYIAVKMLFRPRNAIKLGKFALPFTPGVIPKRKATLAKAVGKTVGNTLFGENEIKASIASEEMKNTFVQGIMQLIGEKISGDKTSKTLFLEFISEETYLQKRNDLTDKLSDRIAQELLNMDIGKILTDKGTEAIKQKISNPMLSFLINEKTIKSFAEPIGERINEYIRSEGKSKIESFIAAEIAALEDKQLNSFFGNQEDVMLKMQNKLGELYIKFVTDNIADFAKNFKISEIVEEKISNMSNESLEELTLSVMQNELNAIVYLGAVIGFVIGILNIFI